MPTMTKEEFEKHIDSYSKINFAIANLAESYVTKFDPGYLTGVETEYDGVLGTIVISTEYSHCSCCGSDYNEHRIPMRYLWEKDWAEQEQAKRDAEQARRDEEKYLREEEKKKKDAEAERKLFERLKEKYK